MANRDTDTLLSISTLPTGLSGLEHYVEYGTVLYILRSLYHIIFKSYHCRETQQQLQQRIDRFEQQSNLPKFLSVIPITELLIELEDAQFRYPICRYDITLPTFNQ